MTSTETECREYLISSLNNKVFSGAAVGFSRLSKGGKIKRYVTYAGFTEDKERKNSVNKDVLFDLASLTKPLVTVLCTLNLINEGVVGWREKLSSLLSHKVNQNKRDITLSHLLSHCSGLPAHRPYYKEIEKGYYKQVKNQIISRILDEQMECRPGQKNIYSDLGYILLGNILEKKSGMSLKELWVKRIADSFHLSKKLLFLKNSDLGPKKCVATSIDKAYLEPVCGIVNDDNCRIMGGVAGHAGLFGTLEGVLSICEKILKQYENIICCDAYSNSILRKALSRKSQSTWSCGFDTPSLHNSVAGQYFSRKSVGHLGYTGTSFWIDLEKGIVVVVLTNRIYMKTSIERMNCFRKKIHDTIMKGLSDEVQVNASKSDK